MADRLRQLYHRFDWCEYFQFLHRVQCSAPFVRRRCDCLASSAPFTNIQTYLLTYLPYSLQKQRVVEVINWTAVESHLINCINEQHSILSYTDRSCTGSLTNNAHRWTDSTGTVKADGWESMSNASLHDRFISFFFADRILAAPRRGEHIAPH